MTTYYDDLGRELAGVGARGGDGLDAASYFDGFATPQFAPWVRSHIALITGYPPFADSFPSLFGLPLVAYPDPATEGQAPLGAAEVATYVGEVRRDVQAGYSGVFIDDGALDEQAEKLG